jgi:hypothetical protein
VPNRTEAFIAGISIDDDATPSIINAETLCQQPSTVYKVSQRDAEVCTVYKSWDCKSVFGQNPLDNDELQGDPTSNPAEIQAFIFFVRPVVQISTETTVYDVWVDIQYDTIWHELKAMTGS